MERNKQNGFVSIGLVLLLGVSCTPSDRNIKGTDATGSSSTEMSGKSVSVVDPLLPREYVGWVRNPSNGLLRDKTIDDITFSAQYKPYEYIACIEEKTEQISDSLTKRKIAELDGMEYIDLKIALKDGQQELLKYNLLSKADYETRVKYFSFGMQNDISLVENGDTIPCSLFHFERAYDVTPYCTFLLGFVKKAKKNISDETLIFPDRTFHKGIVKLTFSKNDLDHIPKLRTL